MAKSILFLLVPLFAFAGPAGEKVVHGSAAVARPGNNLLEVTQASPRAIVEWDSFSLGCDEVARFVQPGADSAILNRVVGGNMSEIYGRMEGNGHVFLVNPQGVLVGETGRIDCGSFVASAVDMENGSFLDGTLNFSGGDGTVVNRGVITANGGMVYLIGADVENSGVASGDQGVFIQIGEMLVRTCASELEGVIENAYSLAVNREGQREANFVRRDGGRVFLDEEVVSDARSFQYVDVRGTPFPHGGLYIEETLNGLQQLWSVIPERLWYQRFDILVNQGKYKSALAAHPKHSSLFGLDPTVSVGDSRYYFLQNTVIGDPIRICDDYMEFLESPYWKTPDGLEQLMNLQMKALK